MRKAIAKTDKADKKALIKDIMEELEENIPSFKRSDTEDEEENRAEEAVRNPRVRGIENDDIPQGIRITRSGRKVAFEELDDPEIFIIDSGASSHTTNNRTGAIAASIGHIGGAVTAESALTLKGIFVDKDGNQGVAAVLQDVKYSEDYNFNLLSMTKLTDDEMERAREVTFEDIDIEQTYQDILGEDE